jgi:hypothetical protein
MAIYICPLHTDIRSDRPGKCSKCGVRLEQREEKRPDQPDRSASLAPATE